MKSTHSLFVDLSSADDSAESFAPLLPTSLLNDGSAEFLSAMENTAALGPSSFHTAQSNPFAGSFSLYPASSTKPLFPADELPWTLSRRALDSPLSNIWSPTAAEANAQSTNAFQTPSPPKVDLGQQVPTSKGDKRAVAIASDRERYQEMQQSQQQNYVNYSSYTEQQHQPHFLQNHQSQQSQQSQQQSQQSQQYAQDPSLSKSFGDESKEQGDQEPLPDSRGLLAELIPVFQHTRKIMQKTVNQMKSIQKRCEGDADICNAIDLAVEMLISHRPPITASLNRIKLRLSAPDSEVVLAPPAPSYPPHSLQPPNGISSLSIIPETPTDAPTPGSRSGGKVMDFPDAFHPDHATGNSHKMKGLAITNSPSQNRPPKAPMQNRQALISTTPTAQPGPHNSMSSQGYQNNGSTHSNHQILPNTWQATTPTGSITKKPSLSVSTDDHSTRNGAAVYQKATTPTWTNSPTDTQTSQSRMSISSYSSQPQYSAPQVNSQGQSWQRSNPYDANPSAATINQNHEYQGLITEDFQLSHLPTNAQHGQHGQHNQLNPHHVHHQRHPGTHSVLEHHTLADQTRARDFKSVPNSPIKTTTSNHLAGSASAPQAFPRRELASTPQSAPAGRTTNYQIPHIVDLLQRFCSSKFGEQICMVMEDDVWTKVASYLADLCCPNQQLVELTSKISKTFVDLVASSCMPILSQLEPIDALHLMQSIQALLQPWYASPPAQSLQQSASRGNEKKQPPATQVNRPLSHSASTTPVATHSQQNMYSSSSTTYNQQHQQQHHQQQHHQQQHHQHQQQIPHRGSSNQSTFPQQTNTRSGPYYAQNAYRPPIRSTQQGFH